MSLDPDLLFSHETGPETCRICHSECPTAFGAEGGIRIHCPRCGPFYVTDTAWAILQHDQNRSGWIQLSGWCRDQQLEGREPAVNSEIVGQSHEWPRPDLMSRAERLLQWNIEALEWRPNGADYTVMPTICQLGASYSANYEELQRLNRLLEGAGHYRISTSQHVQTCYVTARGRLRMEELQRSREASPTAFVAMWFSESTNDAWENGIQLGVQEAGYDPVRVDQIEHAGRIDDQIILQINRSRFIVADFTGHRGGVYFEAGYALGRGLDVIWTCHESDIDQLHFDIRQYNCIVWQEPEDLRRRLPARIENTVGLGPRVAASG